MQRELRSTALSPERDRLLVEVDRCQEPLMRVRGIDEGFRFRLAERS